jgi:hypothetical protein
VTLLDKLEIGLKEDAPFRKDNLPRGQIRGPEIPAGPDRSPEVPLARGDKSSAPPQRARTAPRRVTTSRKPSSRVLPERGRRR